MEIEILNKQDVGEPSRPYDFSIDHTTTIGQLFISTKEKDIDNISSYFKKEVETKEGIPNLHIKFMLTAYKEFGKIRLFCGDITQKCYGEIVKDWLEIEILKLRKSCSIYLPKRNTTT